MDEKLNKRKLIVLDRTEEEISEAVEQKVAPKISHPGQSNPIYKNLAKFENAKIGDKLTVKDLLR